MKNEVQIHHVEHEKHEPFHEKGLSNDGLEKKFYLRWLKKSFLVPLFYVISGVFLFFSLGIISNSYVFHLKVDSAVVSSPIETITAPTHGYITQIFVSLGEKVKKGSPLFKIENMDLERELELARVTVEEAKLNVSYYKKLLNNEKQRLKVYQHISTNRLISAKALVEVSQSEMDIAQHNLERIKKLHGKHYISEVSLELEKAKYERAQEKYKNALAQYNMEKHSSSALPKGIYFTGNKTEGIERDLYAELETAEKKIQLNKARVKVYERLINKLTLTAPFDGIINQILKSPGNTLDNQKPVLFIEKLGNDKNITAYLTQDEVVRIGSSKQVQIYIPSIGKKYHGEIIKIDRTDGFIDVVKAQYRWRDFQIDRSAMITIAIQEKERKDFVKKSFSGMPVIVYFAKNFHFLY